MKKLRIAVMASTKGTDLEAIIAAVKAGTIDADLRIVISDLQCPAVEKARAAGVKAVVVDKSRYPRREDFDSVVSKELDANGVELVCLAGYMRLFSPGFVKRFWGRLVNVHPSLLPAFAGGTDLNVHQAVLDAGAKETGCTIHFVDEGADTGPIIAQERVPVLPGDTAETLKARVQEAEKRLYPRVIQMFAEGKVRLDGRKVVIG